MFDNTDLAPELPVGVEKFNGMNLWWMSPPAQPSLKLLTG